MRPSRTFPPLACLRASLLTAVLATSLAHAQAPNEWNTFPPSSPPSSSTPATPAPTPEKQPDAQPPPASAAPVPAAPTPAADAPSKPAAEPAAAPPPTPAATPPAATAKPEPTPTKPAEPEPAVVSTQERFLPGSEPHSPSTLGNPWNDRKNLRHTSGMVGGVGLLRVAGSDPGPRGLLRFSATGEYFANSNFPVQDAENTRTSGTFALSYVPLEFLEVFGAYTVSANTNSRSSPNLIQALGDISLGARGSRQWAPGFRAGAELRVMSFSGVGNQDVDRYAFGFAPRVLATYDVREFNEKVPLRAHANLGLIFDGTGDLVNSTRLNAAEEYALNVNRYNRLGLGLGVEAPLTAVTPFLEFNLAYPLGTESGGLVSPDGRLVSAASAAQKTLGLGAKVTALRDITFTVGAEFGLTRTVGLGVPATPPFNLFFGASYTVDLLQRGTTTKIVETVRERKVDGPAALQTGQVSGVVVDAQTRKPLAGVLVTVPGAGLPPVATDPATGRFLTHALPAGGVRLAIQKEGYKLVEQDATLTAGQTTTVEVAMEAVAKPAAFAFSTTSKKKPVAATLRLKGAKEQELTLSESSTAPTKVEVPAGSYVVNVLAPGYLAQTRAVQVAEGATQELAFELEPEPKKKLVEVKENKLELLQPVQFSPGKTVILADSYPLLAQVVDAIVRNDLQRLRIEGHTDNQGNPELNLQLSKERAQAVATYLTQAGIDASRLEVVGHGDTKPIAPNLTPRGRELNRRVEFFILER
ncbi:OmpA family protein [Hyalangium rubrum]|uniref:OmpA family protein n=1 Tax=Hyalangium rubrum TaxID=3103134 RepID=A0ABU5H9C9_9BACT|nr:OmpA family protein [Hyalangium sp. s54d21]MDY7229454.1 OmpA family protein [Hyalangium sp. s54d21]